MEDLKIVELKASIIADKQKDANDLKNELKADRTCLLNLMSSPGSGKTTTLLALNKYFKNNLRFGVLEADIDSDYDALIMRDNGIKTIQLHTDGMCHLDAGMTREGLKHLDTSDLDFVVLENIGNLVCPAEFDTGAQINATILSVPEGDDKPVKYPLMYEVSDILIINKIDTISYFDFDMDKVRRVALMRNPNIKIFTISAKTGEGVEELANYLMDKVYSWIGGKPCLK